MLYDQYPGLTALEPGKRVGFDVIVADLDHDDGRIVDHAAWVPFGGHGGHKMIDASTLADLVLLGPDKPLVNVSGTVEFENELKPSAGVRVQFYRSNWIGAYPMGEAVTDANGRWSLWLPPGEHQITIADRKLIGPEKIKVEPGKTQKITIQSAAMASGVPRPWRDRPSLNGARHYAAAAVASGKIYVAGKWSGGNYLASFEVYDPAIGVWAKSEPMPVAAADHAMAALGNKIYVTGGHTPLPDKGDSKETWAFDVDAGIWSRRADVPGAAVGHGMAALGDRLYVVGWNTWSYDPERNAWKELAAPPQGRWGIAVTAYQGRILAIGGRHGIRDDGVRGSVKTYARVDAYDPSTDSWSSLPELLNPRGAHVAVVIGQEVHVVGGGRGKLAEHLLWAHEVLRPEQEQWHAHQVTVPARTAMAGVAFDGALWLIGGANRDWAPRNVGHQTVWSLEPSD